MKPITPIAEIKVSYQPTKSWDKQPVVSSTKQAYNLVKSFFPKQTVGLQETFVVFYFSRNNRLKAAYRHSIGSLTGTVADIRLILGVALKTASTSILIAHNHPSGNLHASGSDMLLTEKLYKAAGVMDIILLDHIIVSPKKGKYLSFADAGLMKY